MKKIKTILICCIGLLFCSLNPVESKATGPFENLKDITLYAKQMPEYPDPKLENVNWLNPNYTEFHEGNAPSGISKVTNKILRFFKLTKKIIWCPEKFKNLLEELSQERELAGREGNFVEKFTPASNANIVVFGDIQGAFHSFARNLKKLHQMEIINEELEILNKNDYILFGGDLIDRSPYILETLSIAMVLIEKNPKNVFYVLGNHENKEEWHNHGLRRELEIRMKDYSDERIPLNTEVKRFFNTLPRAVYLRNKENDKAQLVRISHYGRNEDRILKEPMYSKFLYEEDDKKTTVIDLDLKKESHKNVNVRAIIKGQSRSTTFQKTDGLKLLPSDKGATAWTILSAPTSTYRILYHFFNDVFTVINTPANINDWTITLYKNDVRTKTKFETVEYKLISGMQKFETVPFVKEPSPIVEKPIPTTPKEKPTEVKEITQRKGVLNIGCVGDLTASASRHGKLVSGGSNLRIQQENKIGGISGQTINFVIIDDEYDPALTPIRTKEFRQNYNSNIFLSSTGSPTTLTLIPDIAANKIGTFFPYTGSTKLRQPNLKGIIHFKQSYGEEAKALINYGIKTLNVKKFAIFYQDDEYGISGLNGAVEILKKNGITKWCEASYLRKNPNIDSAVQKIKEFDPEVIFFNSLASVNQKLIEALGTQYLMSKKLLGNCVVEALRDTLKIRGLNIILSRTVPNLNDNSIEIVQEYNKAIETIGGVPKSPISFEGYLNADLFIHILKKIDGPITKDKVIDQFEKIKNYTHKGVLLNFDPQTRTLSKKLWIDPAEDTDWITLETKTTTATPTPKQKESIKKTKGKKTDKLVVGCTLDLSKGSIDSGNAIRDGITFVFNEANSQGGINGLQLEAIFLDDEYQPTLTQQHVKTLKSEYDCDILLCPFGYPVVSLIPKVKNKEVLVAFPYDGSMELRDKELKYMLNIRPACYHEAYALVKHANKNLKGRRFAIFYMDSSYGKSGLTGAQQALKDLGITEWLETSHLPNSMNVNSAVEKIKKFNPDTILFCSIHEPANELVRQLEIINVMGKNLLGIHPHGHQRATLKKLGLDIVVTRIVPSWKDDSIQLIKEYNSHIKNAGRSPTFASLEGFIAATVFVDALKKIKGEVTNDKIVEAVESMKNYNLKGLELDFKPEIRTLAKKLWIDVGDDQEWIPVDIKF